MGFEFEWTAYTSTIDQTGTIFFPRVFERVDDGIQELLRSVGYPLHRIVPAENNGLPIVHAEADYRRPVRQGDRVLCDIVPAVGETSIRFDVACRVDGETAVQVQIVRVSVDFASSETQPVPERLRDELSQYA